MNFFMAWRINPQSDTVASNFYDSYSDIITDNNPLTDFSGQNEQWQSPWS